jgi:hypothetical protein
MTVYGWRPSKVTLEYHQLGMVVLPVTGQQSGVGGFDGDHIAKAFSNR